jgi:pSer/pThr/pTyr-binding forkhead associated (FHA) protein
MNARLVSYDSEKVALAFPLEGAQLAIGREADNDIQLPHERVSKRHAALVRSKDGWSIRDLHSTNGVFVNGNQVRQADLKHGDRVKIGPYELHFETKLPEADWVPSYLMDFSTKVHDKTLVQNTPAPKKPE